MPASDAPTRPAGIANTAAYASTWGGAIDALEHVADLTWPLSVRTYARMRHDPTLSSVLSAYRLPILAARWEIDPRGASDRMVKLCADSLGLPVRGEDEKPGPVRRRGVKWLDHLRAATSAMTFGHAVFEPVYRIDSGAAVLDSLGDRPQLTIAEVEADRQGNLVGIQQYGDVLQPNPPAIPADRLLWYAIGREGSNWTGTSLIRPAFGAWLLKQDALRVTATSLRRFGSGTPVARALPGTEPTQAQMDAAQAAASNVRVGDSAGAVMPPGFVLDILGVQGSYPDGLPFLRYLDEQMARAALASMLDLGNTANGSRALGDTFADLLALAQQATAETIAETATELCVRLTDYNEGDTAPAPAVVVGDVGSSRQVLAQSVSDLVKAGAVVLDDDLENWIRDAMGAPAKAAPTPAPAPAVPPVPPGQDPQQDPGQGQGGPQGGDGGGGQPPTPAGTPPTPVKAAAGDTPARPLTPDEEAAGLDPAAIDTAHGDVVAALVAAWAGVQAAQIAGVVAQIPALAASGAAALAGLTVDTTDAGTVLAAGMLEAADAGVRLAVAEAARQGVTIDPPGVDQVAVEDVAHGIAAVMGQQTAAAAAREAIRLQGLAGSDPQQAAAGVESFLTGLSDGWTTDQLSGAATVGLNTGRAQVFAAAPVKATFYASESLDGNTCQPCRDIDGHAYPDLGEALADYPLGPYVHCQGRWRCRGIVAAKYSGEPTPQAELVSLTVNGPFGGGL